MLGEMESCWLLVDWFPAGRGTGLVGWEGMGRFRGSRFTVAKGEGMGDDWQRR